MTAYKHLLKPKFSLQKKQREALSDWLGVQIQKTKGAGWDVKVKGIRYRAGHNGAWRMSNTGAAMATLCGFYMLTTWASGGKMNLQWWETMLMTPSAIAVAESFRGAGSAFRAAREKGKGAFTAFSMVCKRVGLGLASAAPNVATLPFVGFGGLLKMATTLSNVVSIKKPGGKLEAWALATESKIFAGAQAADSAYEAVIKWKAGKLVKASALESNESQAQSIYHEVAAKFMAQRLGFTGVGAEPGDVRTALLAEQTNVERIWADKFEPYLRRQDLDADKIETLMRRADAANVPPWHCPTPGMPTLCELTASLANWSSEENQDMSNELKTRIDAWATRCEAQNIRTHIDAMGQAGAVHPRPASRRL